MPESGGTAGEGNVGLPGIERALIPPEKIRDYLLADFHPVGRAKAAVFRSLGYGREHGQRLEMDIRTLAARSILVGTSVSPMGQKVVMTGTLTGPTGASRRVRTVWILLGGDDFPRFVTAFPETQR